ncbi:MAG: FliA/WhiG family RNA polymerase sigma factor [Candidatus Scalindua sp. AMX11]|nr:MAG: FliA/WhiG family RNA polymerase sigma factor [Candidatus Scalindua sp.]NOG85792.1 FliA/WhiG family RNA polymerase sigma factor [Planctomycetota bacterium]RZV97032.1 MAG: FliA/WhiG family RNA polymerase sigma factor [Candidatus Scalindua sp. SCAELEC01]TDE66354.1 MAG: FliA/WhiG family RNA polymerase sigma factor [Candidatus Scalindua sp. AMX11]GJQ58254.1 MAG: RNA polymerase sigma factor [Candidatus Scalindua sp.]
MQATVIKKQLSKYKKESVDNTIRDKLITEYLPLVKYVVGRLMVNVPTHVDREDLIESGILGLIEAAQKYDTTKQVQFKTYAFHRIRGSILDYLRLQDWVPRSVREKDNLIKKTYNTLEQRLKRPPQPGEIAEELGMSYGELHKILVDIGFCSLLYLDDMNTGNDEYSKMSENVKDQKTEEPLEVLESEEEKRQLARAITELQPKERLVITLYYYEEMLLREIAEVMHLSESRVSQLHHRALLAIRVKVNKKNSTNIK